MVSSVSASGTVTTYKEKLTFTKSWRKGNKFASSQLAENSALAKPVDEAVPFSSFGWLISVEILINPKPTLP
jgi:hypothetical protein